MSDSPASALSLELDELLDEVAAAWELDRDYRVAVHLAATNPDHADEIYAFLDRLVDTATAPTPLSDARAETAQALRDAITEVHQELETPAGRDPLPTESSSSGGQVPLAESAVVEPLIDYAVEMTGLRPSQIADCLGVSVSFLDDVNTYPDVVPLPVRAQIVDLAEARLELDRRRSEQSLHFDPRQRMAACRRSEYLDALPTFDDILERSGMKGDQLRAWSGAISSQTPPR